MDPITFGKAKQTINKIKQVNDQILAPLVEGRFITLQERLDWIEAQANAGKLTRDVQIDLSQGVLSSAEVVNGKIELKATGKRIDQITDAVPKLTSDTSASPIVITCSSFNAGGQGYAWKAFNDTNTGSWDCWHSNSIGVNGEWLKVDFGIDKILYKYAITSRNDSGYPQQPKMWKFQGSNDNSIWTDLHTASNETWLVNQRREFLIPNPASFRYYRILITASTIDSAVIGELELFESTNIYFSSGDLESPIIDLSQGWIKTNLMSLSKQIQSGLTDCAIEIAYSTDGQSFSAYAPIDTANPPQARYIKLKATLTAATQPQPPEVVEYDQTDPRTEVTLNEYVVANGDLKLQTEYQYPMTKDAAYTETGALFRKTLDKNSFKSIEKIEVR